MSLGGMSVRVIITPLGMPRERRIPARGGARRTVDNTRTSARMDDFGSWGTFQEEKRCSFDT